MQGSWKVDRQYLVGHETVNEELQVTSYISGVDFTVEDLDGAASFTIRTIEEVESLRDWLTDWLKQIQKDV
jgi:hypothetical protein